MDDGQIVIELVGKDQATRMMVKNLQEMGAQAKHLEGQAGGAMSGLTGKVNAFTASWGPAIMAAAAGYASIKTIKGVFQDFLELAASESALFKTATRLNLTTETLSGLGYVAIKAGMDVETFNKSLERMQKNISAAALGNEQATTTIDDIGESSAKGAGALRELGLNAQMLNQLPVDQKLVAIAAAMKQNIDPADRSRIALDLLGRGGGQMIVALAAGPEAMQRWIDKMEQLGGIVSTSGAKAMLEAKSASTDLSIAYKNLSREIYEGTAPAFTYGFNELTKLLLEMKRGGGEADLFGSKFNNTIGSINNWGDNLGKQIPKIEDFAKSLLLIPPLSMIFGPLLALPSLKAPKESVGPYGEAAETFYGPASLPKGLIGPGSRDKLGKGGGGGAAKAPSFTEVSFFEQAMWTADDAEKGFQAAGEKLAQLLGYQEKLVEGQKSYFSEMASLSPLLSDQLKFKDEALRLENEHALMVLARELDEKKINQTIYDQEVGFRALVTQAKRLSLEREKWAKGGGVGAGLQLYWEEQDKKPAMGSGVWWKDQMTGAETWIGSTFANTALDTFQDRKTDFRAMGQQMLAGFFGATMQQNFRRLLTSFRGEGDDAGFMDLARQEKRISSANGDNWGDVPNLQKWDPILETWAEVGNQNEAAGEILNLAGGQGLASAATLGLGAVAMLTGSKELMMGVTMLQGVIALWQMVLMIQAATDWIPFFHQGGPIYAHSGWPRLRADEVPIIAQTGERVLSRRQNRDYEAGQRAGEGSGGGSFRMGDIHLHVHPSPGVNGRDLVEKEIWPAFVKKLERGFAMKS